MTIVQLDKLVDVDWCECYRTTLRDPNKVAKTKDQPYRIAEEPSPKESYLP